MFHVEQSPESPGQQGFPKNVEISKKYDIMILSRKSIRLITQEGNMKIKPIKTFGSISVWANYFNPLKNDPSNPPVKDKDIYFVNLSSDENKIFPKVFNEADPKCSLGKVYLDKWIAPFNPPKDLMQAVRWATQFALDGKVTYDMIKKPVESKTPARQSNDPDLADLIRLEIKKALKGGL